MEGEYEWVREYLYDVRQDEEKRTYVLRETPTYMGYVDLNTRLMVHKRGKRMKSGTKEASQNAEFPRPEKVWPALTHEKARSHCTQLDNQETFFSCSVMPVKPCLAHQQPWPACTASSTHS